MRSGTTLLGNIIDRHSSIAVFIESSFIPRYFFTQILFWPLKYDENYRRLARCIVDEPASQKNGMKLDESRVMADKERTLSSLVSALFDDWAHSRGKRRWADKSPGYISKISVLDRMFPEARFIHIIRDGRDVWLSLKRLRWESDPVKVAADWARTVSRARCYGASMPSRRYLEVQYERLVAAPEQEVRRIMEFLGESYEPAMIEPDQDGPGNPALAGWPKVDRAIDASNSQKWRNQLSNDEQRAFDLCARSVLASLGYECPARHYSYVQRTATKLHEIASRAGRPVHLARQAVRLFTQAATGRLA